MRSDKSLYDLKVYDDVTGQILGYITAMDDDGIDMVLDQAIDLERESFFTIDNILEMEPGHTALIAGVCLSCEKRAQGESRYLARLAFTQLSEDAEEIRRVLH